MNLKNQIIEDLNKINEEKFLKAKKEIENEIQSNQEKIKTLKIKKAKVGLQSILEDLALKLEELKEDRIKNSEFINNWNTLTSNHASLSDSMSKILYSGVSKEVMELLLTMFDKNDLKNIVTVNKSGAYISYKNVIYLIKLKRKEDTIDKI